MGDVRRARSHARETGFEINALRHPEGFKRGLWVSLFGLWIQKASSGCPGSASWFAASWFAAVHDVGG